jgi:hypothetical protein
MKKLLVVVMAVVVVLSLGTTAALAAKPVAEADPDNAWVTYNGNGAPSGQHYTLNIIAIENDKLDLRSDMDGGNGHRIFVYENGRSKIQLIEGPDFAVLDCVASKGDVAQFQLPDPVLSASDNTDTGSWETAYAVYVRALGSNNGGSANISTEMDKDGYLYTGQIVELSKKAAGNNKFTDVTKQLLSVRYDIDGDGRDENVPLFGVDGADYFWNYDNAGLKHAQLRFYPLESRTIPWED